MNVQPVLNTVRATLSHQAALAGADPAVAAAVNQLVEALGPALRLAAMEITEQAAAEVKAQLPNHAVDVLVVDGDPTLRVTEVAGTPARAEGEDFVSRLTLRLPPSLKEIVEGAADRAGESVNAWVVDALGRVAHKGTKPGKRVTESFEL
ncbi:MAG: YlcI/YnfO family protein [Ilumatobacteraceae bacterium]